MNRPDDSEQNHDAALEAYRVAAHAEADGHFDDRALDAQRHQILARLAPCDLVLVEGYKREAHLKIETRRQGAKDISPLSATDPAIVAVAADHPQPDERLPVLDIDDIAAIADFIAARMDLRPPAAA